MTCPAFGSTSEVSLWYAIDTDPDSAIPDGASAPEAFTWYGVPMTGESLTANLSATISNQITANRSYAGSKLSSGDISGDINIECQANSFLFNMLIAALQADQALNMGADEVTGTDGVIISAVGTGADDDRTVTLTGLSAISGATYSVVIDGENFSFTATTTDIEDVATGLAAAINDDDDYTATAATDVVTISDGAGLKEITFTSFVVAAWAPGEKLVNGSTKKCLVFMKRIQNAAGNYDFYMFRGCQIGSLSLECSPGSNITGTISLTGVKPDTPIENAANPTHWTFVNPETAPFMSGVDSLRDFSIIDSAGVSADVTMQSFNISIDNQLRAQQAVGLGHPYSAGVASGRIMVTFSGSAYYANPRIYNDFVGDNALKISGKLIDSDGDGFGFLADFVKVTSGSIPTAGAPDQDLLIDTEFQAFESASHGSFEIERLAG